MADHLDFIKVRGLETPEEDEVFQGLGGAALTVDAAGGTSQSLEWGEIPADAIDMVSTYTQDLQTWLAEAVRYDPDSGSRALVPELLDDLPVVPLVVGSVVAAGTGAVTLPAVATVMLSQVIMNLVGSSIANYAESLDENSPVNLLKKAFLYDNNGTQESILKTALLRLTDAEKSILQAQLKGIQEGVEDLSFLDAELKFADNTSLHVKGKVLNH